MNHLRFLLRYIRIYKFQYFIGFIFIILTNWVSVSIPKYLQLSIDLLSEDINELQQSQDKLFEYLGVMFLLALSLIVIRALSRIFFFNPGRAIEYRVKNDLFDKLNHLKKDYYDKNPTGAIISRIQNDITGVRIICGFGMMQIFNILSALSFTPYKMWELSPRLTLYCVIPIIVVFVFVRFGMNYVVKHSRKRMKNLQDLSSFIISSLAGIDIIKGFDLGSWSRNEFGAINKLLLNMSLRISFVRSFLMPLLHNLENVLKTLILFVGGMFVIQEDFTIGELTAFIAYAGLLTMPIMGLGWLTTMIQQGLVGLASLETILSQKIPKEKIKELPPNISSHLFNKGIEVKNLNFRYSETDDDILKNINFSIKPNQTLGILGKIGSGKTTLINCLNAYLQVNDNCVFIGERDINTLAYSDINRIIRTVSQDVFLFSDTIENNIIFGINDEIDHAISPMEKVVYESALQEEVDRFPEHMATIVGEKGIMLSGGQKQRISLARSMMQPCDLLILDNVLSAVDYETERFLLKQILKRETAKSLLIISHRVQALEGADEILVFENGTITERGTHQQLIHRSGLYQETWRLQNKLDEK